MSKPILKRGDKEYELESLPRKLTEEEITKLKEWNPVSAFEVSPCEINLGIMCDDVIARQDPLINCKTLDSYYALSKCCFNNWYSCIMTLEDDVALQKMKDLESELDLVWHKAVYSSESYEIRVKLLREKTERILEVFLKYLFGLFSEGK